MEGKARYLIFEVYHGEVSFVVVLGGGLVKFDTEALEIGARSAGEVAGYSDMAVCAAEHGFHYLKFGSCEY